MEYPGLSLASITQEIQNLTRTLMEEDLNLEAPVDGEMIALLTMLSLFTVVGTVGNGLVLFVFSRVRDKTTAQLFILTLALIDLFTCLVIIPFTMFVEFTRYDINYDLLCKLYQFLITSKVPLSAFIMVAIAFDRYFCICHPLRRIITPWRTKVIIACLTLFASLLGVMTSLAYGVYQVYRPDTQMQSELLRRNVTENLQILSSVRNMHWAKLGEDLSTNNDITIMHMVESRLRYYVQKHNLTTAWFNSTQRGGGVYEAVYIGICAPNEILLDWNFLSVYQKCYTALFFVCLVIVGVLYGMIYRFIGLRRSKKLQQKLVLCSYVNGDNVCGEGGTRTTFLNGNGHDDDSRNNCLNNGLGAGGVYIGGCVTTALPASRPNKTCLSPPTAASAFKAFDDVTGPSTIHPRSDGVSKSETPVGCTGRLWKSSTSEEVNALAGVRNDLRHGNAGVVRNSGEKGSAGDAVSNGQVAIEMKKLKELGSPGPDRTSPAHRCRSTPEERRRSVGVGELDKRCPTPPRRRRRTPSPQQIRKERDGSDRNDLQADPLGSRNDLRHRDASPGLASSSELSLAEHRHQHSPELVHAGFGESLNSPAYLSSCENDALLAHSRSTSRESFRDVNIRRYLETSIGDDCAPFFFPADQDPAAATGKIAKFSLRLSSPSCLRNAEQLLDVAECGENCDAPLLHPDGYPRDNHVPDKGRWSSGRNAGNRCARGENHTGGQERHARFQEPDQEDSHVPLLHPETDRDLDRAVLHSDSGCSLQDSGRAASFAGFCATSASCQNAVLHVGEHDHQAKSLGLQEVHCSATVPSQHSRLSPCTGRSLNAPSAASSDLGQQRAPADKRRKSSSSSGSRRSTMETTRTSGTAADSSRRQTMESNRRSTTDSSRHSTMDSDSRRTATAADSNGIGRKKRWHRFRSKNASVKSNQSRGSGVTSSVISIRQPRHYDAERLRDETRAANARTALMLFTVTLVFVVAFLPAWLMAHRIIPNQLTVFYLYFTYNVANPFIYAFMNVIFKEHLRKIFGCKTRS